ncbi:MAG: methylated-DNA--[protein]-cysteine S-methyltransferase [Pseudomonadota bacterium]|nr:methylated-DNA--[protein]-cysteine S-methyltransferase [Pseudomonadota bacterium]
MSRIDAPLATPVGAVAISWEDGALAGVDLEPEPAAPAGADLPGPVAEQLSAYFEDGTRGFDLPVRLCGTPFQLRVWKALRAIPPGHTVTYGQLARELGTSPRAVGGACRANPCPIVVPCHRVVAADGLGGFAGDTSGRKLAVKRWLLRHEGVEGVGD